MSDEPPASEQSSGDPWPSRRGVRVLVVDDHPDVAESMALVLRLYGHETDVAHDGAEALRLAQVRPPQVVLLDLSMPKMDGCEVARQLREMFRDRPLLLVAITALGFEEDLRRCREAGFDRHFVKPADPAEVERLVRELASSLQP